MKQLSLRRHVGLALLVLGLSYALVTLLPNIFPHPEDFSPWAYLVAFLVVLLACLRLPKGNHRWGYWLILFLCSLAFMDETGFGVEVFGWQPLFIEKYNVEIHDLHSLIGLIIELTSLRLQELRWNGAQFVNFLLFDVALLILGGSFLSAIRWRLATAREPHWQERILRLIAWVGAAIGAAAALYLFTLPQDPKNAFLFGFSLARLVSALFILLLSFLPLAIFLAKGQQVRKWPAAWLKKNDRGRRLAILVFTLCLLALVYQFCVPFVFLPDQQTRLERLTPLTQWALAESFILSLALLTWIGKFRRPFADLWFRLTAFLKREPAFFYAGFAVALIIVAQLIDREMIPLNQWISTPNFHVELWGLWTEEAFEMTAAYEFMLACYFFPTRLPRKRSARKK